MKKLAVLFFVLALGSLGGWWLLRPLPHAPAQSMQAAAPQSGPAVAPAKIKTETPASPTLAAKANAAPPPIAASTPAVAPTQAAAPAPMNKPALEQLLLPGNKVFDAQAGLMVTYPADWQVRDTALRWGKNNNENTIFFAPPAGNQAVPSMYYRQQYPDGPTFQTGNAEAMLRDMAKDKEASRSNNGANDYKNDPDSFVFRTIDGHPSLSYFATYTDPRSGEINAEYFLRILGPTGYVMFFNRGPVKDVQALIPAISQMGGTVKPP